MKTRVRFGIRLGWPIINAATFVIYLPELQFSQLRDTLSTIRTILSMGDSKAKEIADRIVCERG